MLSEHYLDNAATTRVLPEVAALIGKVLTEDYGNPSSLHRKGQEAEKYIRTARKQIADILKCDPKAVYFTSCATESTTSVLQGVKKRMIHQGRHILTTPGEHSATSENLKQLFREGFEIEQIDVDETGKILIPSLEEKLRDDTVLVTILHINNETGVIQPIEEIAKVIKRKNPKTLFHVDATQSFAKYPIFPERWGIDFLSASAHKINGPKGIGLLYIKRGFSLPSLILGGGQESHFRSGTENVPYIAGFGLATKTTWEEREKLLSGMNEIKQHLLVRLMDEVDGVHVNGPEPNEAAAHILNLRIDGIRSEVLLHALEDYGVYVSSGSACSSNNPSEKSPSLHALGLTPAQMDESIRISFGRYSTMEDADAFVDAAVQIVPMLRRFKRK
ncbi:MAG: cysteine desulfurase [Firmicutes bacterium]|nr:cysteine desulfurase [Bacillota bacterium]